MDNSEDNNTELLVRRILSKELSTYREFLEKQTKLILWGLSLLVATAAGLGVFLFGKSYSDIEAKMQRTVDQKVIEYRIDQNLKDKLNERVTIILDQPEFVKKLSNEVERQTSLFMTQEADKIISQKISDEMKRIQASKLEELISDSVTKSTKLEHRIKRLEDQLSDLRKFVIKSSFLSPDQITKLLSIEEYPLDEVISGPKPAKKPGTVPPRKPGTKP